MTMDNFGAIPNTFVRINTKCSKLNNIFTTTEISSKI